MIVLFLNNRFIALPNNLLQLINISRLKFVMALNLWR